MKDYNHLIHIGSIIVCFGFVFSISFIVFGCSESEQATVDHPAVIGVQQTAFRVRSDFSVDLNANHGWSGELNENVTINVEEPFRIRFELESTAEASAERRYHLQYRRNGGAWRNVDAQKIPNPSRELELNFENSDIGKVPRNWRLVEGNASDMEVVEGIGQPFLQVRTGRLPILVMGQYEVSWEPVEFAAEIRLPDGGQSGGGLIFGYEDPGNYYRVYVDGEGTVRASRIVDGEEATVTERHANISSDQWLELQIALEGNTAEIELGEELVLFTANFEAVIPTSVLGFYVSDNSTAEFQSFVVEGEPGTPRVSIVSSDTYNNGDRTQDLLAGSSSTFVGGAGMSLAAETKPWIGESGQSEWEWPLAIRRFADGAVTNNEDDTFEFRMTDVNGSPISSDNHPVITISVPPGLLGGTFVETPARIGPWEATNGDLYFLMEPSETYNVLMAVKSTDRGKTWQEVDGANRPATGDLEGFASDAVEGTIHMLHQTSDEVLYHAFRMSDHPTGPDTWVVRDDTVATPEEPPTQVATLTVRSDGSMVAVYGGPEKIHYSIYSTDGIWGEEAVIDADLPPAILSGPQTVLGEDDVVHLAYTGFSETNGTIWYRRILPDGTLTPREQLASGVGTSEGDVGSVLPLVFISETNTAVVLYRLSTGKLWERQITNHGPPDKPVQVSDRDVVQNAVDSDQTGADAIADGTSVHVLFIDEDTGSIYHTYSNTPGVWKPATQVVDGIRGQWVRGMPLTQGNDEVKVYGYVYDAGSYGGSGMNRYGEVQLDSN